ALRGCLARLQGERAAWFPEKGRVRQGRSHDGRTRDGRTPFRDTAGKRRQGRLDEAHATTGVIPFRDQDETNLPACRSLLAGDSGRSPSPASRLLQIAFVSLESELE